jgi:hypothetical protein
MQSQLQLPFSGILHSDGVESNILSHVKKLKKFYMQILASRIIVESAHQSHSKGNIPCTYRES